MTTKIILINDHIFIYSSTFNLVKVLGNCIGFYKKETYISGIEFKTDMDAKLKYKQLIRDLANDNIKIIDLHHKDVPILTKQK